MRAMVRNSAARGHERTQRVWRTVPDRVPDECMLCHPEIADAPFRCTRVWEDDLWRLSAVLQGPIPGFAHLEPKRHIPYVTDRDGPEAVTLGPVLARVTSALRTAAGGELAYVYVFGDRGRAPAPQPRAAPGRRRPARRPGTARARRPAGRPGDARRRGRQRAGRARRVPLAMSGLSRPAGPTG
jgi:hypothetical protein